MDREVVLFLFLGRGIISLGNVNKMGLANRQLFRAELWLISVTEIEVYDSD